MLIVVFAPLEEVDPLHLTSVNSCQYPPEEVDPLHPTSVNSCQYPPEEVDPLRPTSVKSRHYPQEEDDQLHPTSVNSRHYPPEEVDPLHPTSVNSTITTQRRLTHYTLRCKRLTGSNSSRQESSYLIDKCGPKYSTISRWISLQKKGNECLSLEQNYKVNNA